MTQAKVRPNPTDQDSVAQWSLYSSQPRRIERYDESENVTIFGMAPSGAHVAEPVWIIWRERIDDYGRVIREYAQNGKNTLVWIYNSIAFDPQPIDDHTPYQIILDNNQLLHGMVAGLPVANIAVLDPDHVTGDQTITVLQDPSNKFTVVGTTLVLTDTVDVSDVAYTVTLKTVDPDNNEYSQIFALYISDPAAPAPSYSGDLHIFDESPIPSAGTVDLINHTVPPEREVKLHEIEVFGRDIGNFQVFVDSELIARKETYWTKYETKFTFNDYIVTEGQTIKVTTTNKKNLTSYFNARLLGVQYVI